MNAMPNQDSCAFGGGRGADFKHPTIRGREGLIIFPWVFGLLLISWEPGAAARSTARTDRAMIRTLRVEHLQSRSSKYYRQPGSVTMCQQVRFARHLAVGESLQPSKHMNCSQEPIETTILVLNLVNTTEAVQVTTDRCNPCLVSFFRRKRSQKPIPLLCNLLLYIK